MDEEKKKQFVEIVYKNCAEEIIKFLQSNKDYIKKQLSRSSAKLFEDDVLKKKKLTREYLTQLLEKLDETRSTKFTTRIIKYFLKDNKELADAITEKKEYDEQELIKFLTKKEKSRAEKILSVFDCVGIDIAISDEEIKKAEQSIKAEGYEKQLEEKEAEIKKLKESQKAEKEAHKKELADIKKSASKELEDKEKEVNDLKDEVERLKNQKPVVQTIIKEVPVPVEKEVPVLEIEGNEEPNPKEEIEEESPSVSIDFETALSDLESRTLLGVVKAEGIRLDMNWIVVSPIVPIISENSNINREEFVNNVDYRGDYSTFILFINIQLLKTILSDADLYDYQYNMTNDEKFACLFEAFCKKIVFFTPQFFKKDDESKYKLNAHLLCKPVSYEDFNNSTFVPSYDISKKDFEKKIAKHEDLVLDNYPYSLSSKLRYIFIKDSVYEINYIPSGQSVDGRYVCWKFNGQEGKEPFKKLELKIGESSSDKYILTPRVNGVIKDLYVKNIMLIQSSNKGNVVFDEDEFISNVSENAKSRNLYYKENDLKNFHVAVKSSNLVILAGPSGIGKTRLPMVYADALGLGSARNTVLFVPISPSYLEPEDVLGYIRPISGEENAFNAEYMESQTGLVSFLIDAAEHKDKIHLVIFDEMNLSQIEHWFAPFISLLEQDPDSRVLRLYSDNLNVKNQDKYPSSINIGENVFFIGTVNIDETTKQISDRLLDRAIVINLAAPSFTHLKDMGTAKTENYPEITYSMFATAINKVGNSATEFNEKEFALINDLNTLLTESVYNKSISFRSLNKMALYLKNSDGLLSRNEALDFIVSQVVVKKINGSKEELDEILSDDDTLGILKVLNDHSDVSEFTNTKKLVQQKILEINKYGFTR